MQRDDLTICRDIEYVPGGGERGLLDVYVPKAARRPVPVVVFFHGGGWNSKDKSQSPVGEPFEPAGFAVVSANYRYSTQAPFPAQLQDAKAVVRWVRARAAEFGFDPDRVASWGSSAGGYLASFLGVTGHTREFDVGPYLEFPSTVRAVVDYYGPSRLDTWADQMGRATAPGDQQWLRSTLEPMAGGRLEESAEALRRASPQFYLRPGAAPHLLLHGTADRFVPAQQSVDFAAACKKVGVPCELILREGGGHGDEYFKTPEMGRGICRFLGRWLDVKG